MELIGTIDWLYCPHKALTVHTMADIQTVLYGSDESRDSNAMVELLNRLGVAFEYRAVDTDPVATTEWEQLDGECIPILRVGRNSILRGFDRIRVQQLFGWVGC